MPSRLQIVVDRTSRVPLYFQVAEQFERAIAAGAIAPGDRIDTEVTLARDLGLSRPTMRQAIQLLVDRGLLVRKRGVGTQVVHGQVRRPLELTSLHDDLAAAGQAQRTDVLGCERVQADQEVAAELRLEVGAEVWQLERLRHLMVAGGEEPLALMLNFLPADVIDLDAADLVGDGLYACLRRAGVTMRVARQRVGARRATSQESRLLREGRNAPVLTMQRTAYDDAGRAVEFGQHAYRPGLYEFDLTLVDR